MGQDFSWYTRARVSVEIPLDLVRAGATSRYAIDRSSKWIFCWQRVLAGIRLFNARFGISIVEKLGSARLSLSLKGASHV